MNIKMGVSYNCMFYFSNLIDMFIRRILYQGR